MGRVRLGILVALCVAAAVVAYGARVRAPATMSGIGVSSSAGRVLRSGVGRSVAVAALDAETGRVRAAVSRAGGDASLEPPPQGAPDRTGLRPGRPNPFNPATTISYTVDRPMHVRLAVYDPSGRLVAVLVDAATEPGEVHEATWRGLDAEGRAVSSGVYFVRMETERGSETATVILLK
jgi:hypothetical protein